MKKTGKCLLCVLLMLALLCACGAAPVQEAELPAETGEAASPQETAELPAETGEAASPQETAELPAQESEAAAQTVPAAQEETKPQEEFPPTDAAVDADAPKDSPLPAETDEAESAESSLTCTFSISCAAILENTDALTEGKEMLLPEDGWILAPTEIVFYDGESVFDVLLRTCRQEKIHLEFEETPLYATAYIEGINNLYEFDCGELSGWMYMVNGSSPNCGCSSYLLSGGDIVCWEYTCDLGRDLMAT